MSHKHQRPSTAWWKHSKRRETQSKIASRLDVCPHTLSRWKKDHELQAQVYRLAHLPLEAALPDILQVIIDPARAGQFQFVKLVLELADKYRRVITVESQQPKVGIAGYAALIRRIERWEV